VIGEVWMLHRVTDSHSDTELLRTYEITPRRLDSLIVEYTKKGYLFISIEDVRKVMLGEKQIKNKFVSITLDDGYRDNYEVAYPIFRKYNVPFCIYLFQSEVTGEAKSNYLMLTTEQILELDNDSLCTLGGHTYSHPKLGTLSKQEQYLEIIRCKDWLEELLGHPIDNYSYPYGSFNSDTIDIISDIGIKQCTAAWGGKIRKGNKKLYTIYRRLVTEHAIQ